jgi:hypothetical protein
MSSTHGLGALPHNKDGRDWLWRDHPRASLAGIEPTRQLWAMHDSTFRINQGSEGTCVGHGTTNLLAGEPRMHTTFPSFADIDVAHDFSRKMYFDITGDTTYQRGAYPRDAMDWCVRKGYASAYYRLASADEVVDYLLNHGIVGFASPWYNSMWNVASNWGYKKLPYLKVDPASGIAGYHWYTLSGIDTQPEDGRAPRARQWNSWGGEWGLNGCAAIALDDLPILYDGDAWVLTEERF